MSSAGSLVFMVNEKQYAKQPDGSIPVFVKTVRVCVQNSVNSLKFPSPLKKFPLFFLCVFLVRVIGWRLLNKLMTCFWEMQRFV